jgi:hypothetical protein
MPVKSWKPPIAEIEGFATIRAQQKSGTPQRAAQVRSLSPATSITTSRYFFV